VAGRRTVAAAPQLPAFLQADKLISLVGTWMQTVAQSWLVYRLTGSALLLGAVGFAGQIPVFLVAPLGGLAADRANRQRIVIATQTASMVLAFILAGLTLSGKVQVWHVFVLGGAFGSGECLRHPRTTGLSGGYGGQGRLDERHRVEFVHVQWSAGDRAGGSGHSGGEAGEGWCFFANAVSYVAVIIGLLLMKVNARARASQHTPPLEHIIEGFQFRQSDGRRFAPC